jgi:hypothetical protein
MVPMFAAAFVLIAAQAVDVDVIEVKGSVEHKLPGQKWEPLKAGSKIKRGTMVQTGIKSGALLRFGANTIVLVRASTFAVINESFAEKNAYTGELRIDVGSVRLEAKPDREEKLDFQISTPQGTAAVRGTVLQLHTNDMGTLAFGQQGLTQFSTPGGWEYELGNLLDKLQTSAAGDLAAMADAAKEGALADDNLNSLDKFQGEKSWKTDAFNPGSDANVLGHQIHPLNMCGIKAAGDISKLSCSFYRWLLEFNPSDNDWMVKGLTPISGAAKNRIAPNDWTLTVHNRPVWILEDIGSSGPFWRLRDTNGLRIWDWNPNLKQWVLQVVEP